MRMFVNFMMWVFGGVILRRWVTRKEPDAIKFIEADILDALICLNIWARPEQIQNFIREGIKVEYRIGQINTALDQLYHDDYVASAMSVVDSEEGMKSDRLWTITDQGREAYGKFVNLLGKDRWGSS